jgi:hypothetical protein
VSVSSCCWQEDLLLLLLPPLLQVPPSGAFSWRPKSVLVKETEAKVDGWQLAGMVQFDALGRPAFLHR